MAKKQKIRLLKVPKHAIVRIPKGLLDEVDRFLQSEDARRLGLDSKADVVTEAVKELLRKHGVL